MEKHLLASQSRGLQMLFLLREPSGGKIVEEKEVVPDVNRVNSYTDAQFSQKVLNQHGAFLVGTDPYEIEIISQTDAIVRGRNPAFYRVVIQEFRFYAEHIVRFWDESHNLIEEYPAVALLEIPIAEIQPSQFYVDESKMQAVRTFVTSEQDLVIPLVRWKGRNVSVDGHTRLAAAVEKGIKTAYGFYTEAGDYVFDFAAEAKKRGIVSPYQLRKVNHEEYEKLWYPFCDEYFANEK